jgi:BASS family bile acid:Na+ symporter
VVAIPVGLGIFVRARAPAATRRYQRATSLVATVAFVVGLTLAVAAVWDRIPEAFRRSGGVALMLNLLGLGLTYAAAHLAGLAPDQRVVLALGAATRQFAVAAFVALTLCRDATLLLPAIAYCLIMWPVALTVAALARRRVAAPDESHPASLAR